MLISPLLMVEKSSMTGMWQENAMEMIRIRTDKKARYKNMAIKFEEVRRTKGRRNLGESKE